MRLTDLVLLYALIGLGCAIAVWRRARGDGARGVLSAAATVPLWPLWAPFALGAPERSAAQNPSFGPNGRAPDAVARIERALADAVRVVAGTPMSPLFTPSAASRISAEVAKVARRQEELRGLGGGEARTASFARLRELEGMGASERAVATARLQHDSLLQLEELQAADVQALDELADLLEALRAQLLVARYAGSSAEGTGAIVSEVWARLEGLGAVAPAP